jgi:hypothetical protein
MLKAASTSETSVNFYQITWRYNPENNLHTRRRENLKSYKVQCSSRENVLGSRAEGHEIESHSGHMFFIIACNYKQCMLKNVITIIRGFIILLIVLLAFFDIA